jgi:AraC family transcriptional regulator
MAATWAMPLDSKPAIAAIGVGIHGARLVEQFQLDLWCLHFYRYRAELVLDGRSFAIQPGCAGTIAPQVAQEYRYEGRSEHLFAHFALARRADSRIVPIGVMQQLGRAFGRIFDDFELAVRAFQGNRARAEARLWDVLWQLAEHTPTVGRTRHPAIDRALQVIELGIGKPMRVADVAREVGLSTTHLRRLFEAECESSVKEFIQARRLERVRHLLQHSTLSVKAIANEVGMSDLQQFNKLVWRHLGDAPSRLRRHRG